MLSFLTLLFPEVRLRMRSFPVALHRPWAHFDSTALVRWSSEIRQVLPGGGPTSGSSSSSLSAAQAVVSPVDLWSDLHNVGWALVSTLVGVPSGTGTYQYFSSFGEGGRCHLTCSYPHFFTIACLIFSLFRDPNALRTEILLQPWKGCQE